MKKIWIAVLLTAAVVMLCGCRLAESDKGQSSSDEMIGVFVTWDKKDGDWMETMEGKAVFGKMREDGTVSFPGIEGYGMYAGHIDEGFITATDPQVEGEPASMGGGIDWRANLFVAPREDRVYYSHKICRTEDGKIYIKPERNISQTITGESHGGGAIHTGICRYATEDGEITGKVTMALIIQKVEDAAEKLVLKEFDEKDRLLKTTTLEKDRIPEKFVKAGKTAYVLAEIHTENGIIRKIDEDNSLQYRVLQKNGIAIMRRLEFV